MVSSTAYNQRGRRILGILLTWLCIRDVLLSYAADVQCDPGHKCKNGSQCIKAAVNGRQKNICICPPGFTDWDCATPLDFCNKHCRSYSNDVPCKQALCNQGACNNISDPPYYSCDCGSFYTGKNCELEYNPCNQPHANPCEHGHCRFIRGTNHILCECHSGWTTNPNQQIIKLNWNGTEVIMSPPCTEKIRRGITGGAPELRPRAKLMWFTVFFVSLGLFLWTLSTILKVYPTRSE